MAKRLIDKVFSERASLIFIALGFGVILLIGGLFLIGEQFRISEGVNTPKFSNFGEVIGGIVGSLWALAGVILFYIALKEQRQFFVEQRQDFKTNRESLQQQTVALQLQTKEFKNQRQELELTRGVFEEQSRLLQLQQFEGTFFNMLTLFLDVINSTHGDIRSQDGTVVRKNIQGREFYSKCIVQLKKDFTKAIESEQDVTQKNQKYISQSFALETYQSFFENHESNLGHFLRSLYNIVKFIMRSNLENEDKSIYLSILTAHMSNDEQGLLFYNSMSKYGETRKGELKMYDWSEEFGIMENIYSSCLMDAGHKSFYPKTYFRF